MVLVGDNGSDNGEDRLECDVKTGDRNFIILWCEERLELAGALCDEGRNWIVFFRSSQVMKARVIEVRDMRRLWWAPKHFFHNAITEAEVVYKWISGRRQCRRP